MLYHLRKDKNFQHDIKITQLQRRLFRHFVCGNKEKYPLGFFSKHPYSHTLNDSLMEKMIHKHGTFLCSKKRFVQRVYNTDFLGLEEYAIEKKIEYIFCFHFYGLSPSV